MQGRDRRAFRALYEHYFPRLAAFFTHLSMPVEESINDTMFEVWRDSSVAESDYVGILKIALRRARLYATESPLLDPGPVSLLANLHIEHRAVMHLVYTGRTPEEVGEILGLSREGIDALLYQARRACAASVVIM